MACGPEFHFPFPFSFSYHFIPFLHYFHTFPLPYMTIMTILNLTTLLSPPSSSNTMTAVSPGVGKHSSVYSTSGVSVPHLVWASCAHLVQGSVPMSCLGLLCPIIPGPVPNSVLSVEPSIVKTFDRQVGLRLLVLV